MTYQDLARYIDGMTDDQKALDVTIKVGAGEYHAVSALNTASYDPYYPNEVLDAGHPYLEL